MIYIRQALSQDTTAIAALLDQLAYPQQFDLFSQRLQELLKLDHIKVWVATDDQDHVVAFIALNLIYDLAASTAIALISYLCVDMQHHREKIGCQLLSYAEQFARKQGCHRIELHCDIRRTDAHHFYLSQGYHSSPLFFRKNLGFVDN